MFDLVQETHGTNKCLFDAKKAIDLGNESGFRLLSPSGEEGLG